MGRIRYYFVPVTNRLLTGPLAVFPHAECPDEYPDADTGQVGEICGAGYRIEHGTNFRPELVGDHPAGTAADFAGLTPCPAVAPPVPECAVELDPTLALLVWGTSSWSTQDQGEVDLALALGGDVPLPYYWLRREELGALAPGDTVTSWASVGQVTNPSTATGIGSAVALAGPDGSVVGVWLNNQICLAPPFLIGHGVYHTLFVLGARPVYAGSSGPMISSALVSVPHWRGIGHFPANCKYQQPAVAITLPTGIDEGTLRLWTWRRGPDTMDVYIDGVLQGSIAWPDSLGGFNWNRIGAATAVTAGPAFCWLYEWIHFDEKLDADNLAATHAYLLGRKAQLDPDILFLAPGDPLELAPGDPLILR